MSTAQHTPGPTAVEIQSSANRATWRVDGVRGRAYYATTYPNSDLVFIETIGSRRPVGGRVVAEQVRAAIAKAKGQA